MSQLWTSVMKLVFGRVPAGFDWIADANNVRVPASNEVKHKLANATLLRVRCIKVRQSALTTVPSGR
jgi:hypothetical protein